MTTTRSARWAGAATAVWLLAAGAAAQQPQYPRLGRGPYGGGEGRMMPAEQTPERGWLRDAAVPGDIRRLSPDERRKLRRDIHEAGRDLYPERMPADHREQRGQ